MPNERRTYAFGPFELDAAERVLRQGGSLVSITPKAVATLLVLCDHHGHIVSKDVLMQSVWPDTAVEEGNLTQNIYTLRKVLASRPDCGIAIETVPRRGYRLVGDLTILDERVATVGIGSVSTAVEVPAPAGAAPSVPRRVRWRPALSAAAVVMLGAALFAFAMPRLSGGTSTRESWPAGFDVRPLSSLPGEKQHPALSPDGNRIAFIWDRGDGHNVWVTPADADRALQLTSRPGGASYPAWDPGGERVAFIRRYIDDAGRKIAGIFVVPAHGGPEQQVWQGDPSTVGSGLDWSLDGATLLMSLKPAPGAPFGIAVVSLTTGATRALTAPEGGVGDDYAAFSPSGDSFAFVRSGGSDSQLRVQSLGDGRSRALPVEGQHIQRIAWRPDGGAVIFASRRSRRLWMAPLGAGAPVPLEGVGPGADDPSIARRSERLVFRFNRLDQNVYRIDLSGDAASHSQALAPTTGHDVQPSISPDGTRIAFVTSRSGFDEIWVMQADGSRPLQLTDLRTTARFPRWSPDGRSIAFSALAPASRDRHIYVSDVASGLTRRLTSGPDADTWPTWSHDAAFVYFTARRGGDWGIWRVAREGGAINRVTQARVPRAEVSADGRYLVYASEAALWQRPLAGGDPTLLFRLPGETAWGGEWRLTPHGIYWVNEERRTKPTLHFFDFDTRASRPTAVPLDQYDDGGGFSIAPDGRWIALGRREYHASELMLADHQPRGAANILSRR